MLTSFIQGRCVRKHEVLILVPKVQTCSTVVIVILELTTVQKLVLLWELF